MDKFPLIHPIPRASSSGMSHLGLNNMLNDNNTNNNHAHAAAAAAAYYNSDHHFHSNNKPNNFLELMANMEAVQSSTETNNNTASDIINMDLSHHHSTNGAFGDGNDHQLRPTGDKKTKGSVKKVRNPRYAFQTRSQVDILDDGYRWRKYGQKAVKNNKFPRSYYRCTHQGCNVKKQVQRLSKDEEIVVTTYEGIHSHPIEKSTDNFEHILGQMQMYTSF